MRNIFTILMSLLVLTMASCSKCSGNGENVSTGKQEKVDTLVLENPEYAVAWSFNSYYHDNSYDINMFDADSCYLYTIAIIAQSDGGITGEYTVDTSKYNFISVITGLRDTSYSVNGHYKIEYTGNDTMPNIYHFSGNCFLIDSSYVLFDFETPIIKTIDWGGYLK